MKDRLLKFLTVKGLSSTKFADNIGVQRSSISHILSGRNNPSYDVISKILTRYPELNSEWLLLGKGQIFKNQEQTTLFDEKLSDREKDIQGNALYNSQIEQDNRVKSEPPSKYEKASIDKGDKIYIESTSKSEPEKKIQKIIIFYSDHTFEKFSPTIQNN